MPDDVLSNVLWQLNFSNFDFTLITTVLAIRLIDFSTVRVVVETSPFNKAEPRGAEDSVHKITSHRYGHEELYLLIPRVLVPLVTINPSWNSLHDFLSGLVNKMYLPLKSYPYVHAINSQIANRVSNVRCVSTVGKPFMKWTS